MTEQKPQAEQNAYFTWDARSAQPARVTGWRKRSRRIPMLHYYLRMAGINVKAAGRIISHYLALKRELYKRDTMLSGCLGMGTDLQPDWQRIVTEMSELGVQRALVRIPVWDTHRIREYQAFIRGLQANGIPCMAAILQNRQAVTDPPFWTRCLETIFQSLEQDVCWYEIGHAWNRFKWGVWTYKEYIQLVETAYRVRGNHTAIRLVGPAVIDFEFYFHATALLNKTHSLHFDALSSLLYVDRRGAPENTQLGFDLAHKALLLRTIGELTHPPDTPFWITETNWPLPVREGYTPTAAKQGVPFELYADYLVRYYVEAMASGMVDAVYWWQLAAHGYGLIDNLHGRWDKRPAWYAMRTLCRRLGGSRLVHATVSRDMRAYTFCGKNGKKQIVAWALGPEQYYTPPEDLRRVVLRDGE